MKTIMLLANILIAVDYGLIGWMFARQIRLPRGSRRENAYAFAAYISLALFFLLCMHTHIDLSRFIINETANEHWYSRLSVLSHVAQGVGGMTFWYLARRHLHISITDRKTYSRATDDGRERYLQARWDAIVGPR